MSKLKKSIWGLLIVGFLSLAVTSFQLFALDLWGWWTFSWLVSVWLVIQMSTLLMSKTKREEIHFFVLSTLGGVLLALAFSPLPLAPVAFIGFVPILWIIYKKRDSKSFFYTFNTLILWNILSTFWVANSTLGGGLMAFIATSLLMSLPLFFYKLVSRRVNDTFAFMSFVSFWILCEAFILNWELSWPWLTLGNAFSSTPALIQWYSYTGVFGGTLWILMVNWILYKLCIKYFDIGEMSRKPLLRVVFVIVIPILISLVQYYKVELKGEQVDVVLVQPNYEPLYEKFSVREADQLKRFISLSESALTDSTDYLIFPETSFGSVEERGGGFSSRAMIQLKTFIEKYPKLNLETGISSYKVLKLGEKPTRYSRRVDRNDGSHYFWESYNATVELENTGPDEIYHKGKMVPGTESFPYSEYLSFLVPIVSNIGGTTAGLGVSKERKVFESKSTGTMMAPMVCYESIYGDYGRDYIKKGTQFIAVETNDGWWGDTPGYKQHLNFARLRAIEYHRDVVRSANTGSCAFINARGDLLSSTKYDLPTTLSGKVTLHNDITFYVKYGDVILRMSFFFMLLILLKLSSELTKKIISQKV